MASRRGARKTTDETDAATGAKTNKTLWLVAGGATAAVLVVVAVVVGAVLATRSPSQSTGPPSASPKPPVLVFDWPESERSGATILVDGRKRVVPASGKVQFRLKPGRHQLVMLRRGYEQIETSMTLAAGETHHYRPQWKPSEAAVAAADDPRKPADSVNPTFDDWLQDLEVAKQKAAKENKDILIALAGSDWCGWSIRMAYEIFFQKEFRQQVDWRFVLVLADFPRGAEAKAKVEDPRRNRLLAEHYQVSGFPRVVLTDSEGRPYAVVGYMEGGVEAFTERLAQWQAIREHRDVLLLNIKMAEGEEKLPAVEKALDLLEKMKLVQYYEPMLNEWLALAEQHDADNKQGIYEALFEATWIRRLAKADEDDRKQVRRIIAELDDWKQKHRFEDADRAALMHLYAAGWLASAGQEAEALKYIQEGIDYRPKDPMLAARLAQIAEALEGYTAGTGFAVTAEGHVLTNHHVIEEEGKNLVQLPGRKDPVPAKVLARDPQRDIALLKVEVPEGVELKPVHIGTTEVHRGTRVGAFGFPAEGAIGSGLKITTGVISADPDQTEEGMFLLDCRVNPGNSGGPLCDVRGNVVGMVTAKSLSTAEMDSYGMALPAKDLREFLKKHLPDYEKLPAVEPSETRLEWDEIDRIVGPAVLLIRKAR